MFRFWFRLLVKMSETVRKQVAKMGEGTCLFGRMKIWVFKSEEFNEELGQSEE